MTITYSFISIIIIYSMIPIRQINTIQFMFIGIPSIWHHIRFMSSKYFFTSLYCSRSLVLYLLRSDCNLFAFWKHTYAPLKRRKNSFGIHKVIFQTTIFHSCEIQMNGTGMALSKNRFQKFQ